MSQTSKSSAAAKAPLKLGKGVTGAGPEDGSTRFGQGGSGSGGICMPDPEKIRKLVLKDKDKEQKPSAKTSGIRSGKTAASKP